MNNAADRKEIRKAEKASAIAARQDLEVATQIMSTTAGREWIMRRIALAFITPFTSDPHMTAFNCGIQNEAIKLMTEIMNACPDQYLLAMREQNERNAAGERSRSKVGDGGDNRSGEGAVDGEGNYRYDDDGSKANGYDGPNDRTEDRIN